MELYDQAVSKYGERYKPIFAILPEQVIQKFIEIDYLQGIRQLNSTFAEMIMLIDGKKDHDNSAI